MRSKSIHEIIYLCAHRIDTSYVISPNFRIHHRAIQQRFPRRRWPIGKNVETDFGAIWLSRNVMEI